MTLLVGPGLGRIQLETYATEQVAIPECASLAQAMTLKSAAAELLSGVVGERTEAVLDESATTGATTLEIALRRTPLRIGEAGSAHLFERRKLGKLIRPSTRHIGPPARSLVQGSPVCVG